MWKEYKSSFLKIGIAFLLFLVSICLPVTGVLKLIVFLIPYLIVGFDVLASAVKNIAKGRVFSESFLMSVATIGAFALGEYPEAVLVMLLSQIGELFEDIATDKSKKSISALLDIRPDTATVLRDEEEKIVAPQEVAVGETIRVKPGERVPLDAVVIQGTSTVDSSHLTGESMPTEVTEGDVLYSGSINLNGVLEAKTTSDFSQSTVSKILELTEHAAEKKSKSEAFISRFAKYYTPIVVISAVLLAVVPPIILHAPFADWIQRALIFLVVSCPCALVISVPLSFFAGIGGASKAGVLVKGATNLEGLAKTDTVVFDKTGTLTTGSFAVTKIEAKGMDEKELLQLVASIESFSPHPIAKAILTAAKEQSLELLPMTAITEISGMGLSAEFSGSHFFVGNRKLMEKENIPLEQNSLDDTAIYIVKDEQHIGTIYVADTLKAEAKETVDTLKQLGIQKTVMLTGDKQSVCDRVQEKLALDEAYAQLLPQDKVKMVEDLLQKKAKNHTLAFVGDGMNDAPSLVRADVGIAMGALGSDAAIEAADVVLMDDNPLKLVNAIKIAKKTMHIVYFNITFVLAVKIAVLILGALGLTNMWIAIFADVGVMVLAVLNAMRAMKIKQNKVKSR